MWKTTPLMISFSAAFKIIIRGSLQSSDNHTIRTAGFMFFILALSRNVENSDFKCEESIQETNY